MNTTTRNILVAGGMVLLLLAGIGAWLVHGNPSKLPLSATEGRQIALAKPEFETVPSVALARTVGWQPGETPRAASGLAVERWAEGLAHPRTMLALPNGDILVAETAGPSTASRGIKATIEHFFMRRVGADVSSANNIVLLRPTPDGSRVAQRFVLRHGGLASPSGMAFLNDTLYVANHDAILAFPYKLGETRITAAPRSVTALPGGGGHWMRNLLPSADGKSLFVAIGSASNIGEQGLEKETRRGVIGQVDLASGHFRLYAAGLRNANGMAIHPGSGELWTVVNERDMAGPDLVPDYLTNVPVGAHYGWPWVYWKDVVDPRVNLPMPEFLTDYTRRPEYALGAHTAALGLLFARGGERMGPAFANGAFIARHGSWNRKPPVGYDVVFVKFDSHGNPQGNPVPVLTGFLQADGTTHGRPTWLAWAKDGSLLVSDDTAGIIWRVRAPGAAPSPAIAPVVTAHLPPQHNLNSEATLKYGASFKNDDEGR